MKNIEEKIRKAADDFAEQECELGELDYNPLYKGFYHGAKWALSHQWISVEDELPNHNHNVLVLCDSEVPELRYTTAAYLNGIWIYPDEWYYDVPVLMWMPIPPLPNARKEDKE